MLPGRMLVPLRTSEAPQSPVCPSPVGAVLTFAFGTCDELTSPVRQNFTTNRPRRRCLPDEHGLVALGQTER